MGRRLDLKTPTRYTEKIQWYKLNYHNPLLPSLVDKYDVKDYIRKMNLEDCLVEDYGVYDNYDDIRWDVLPSSFVIKDTLGGGSLSVIIVKDKKSFSQEKIRSIIDRWVRSEHRKKTDGREWPYYSGKPHRIIVEKYLESKEGLTDYKFFCFNGMVGCVYVIGNRKIGGHGQLAIMDKDFNRLPYQSKTQERMLSNPDKPANYEKMVKIAQTLSEGFPHVRVDLYNIEGKIYFGELTFYGASGYQQFVPDDFDFELGKLFKLEKYSEND